MFQVDPQAPDRGPRTGELRIRGKSVRTPLFVSVASWASLLGILPSEFGRLGVEAIGASAYLLGTRPGIEPAHRLGGAVRLAQGFPYFAENLPDILDLSSHGSDVPMVISVSEAGIVVRNHVDGSESTLTPESFVTAQIELGFDVLAAFALPTPLSVRGKMRAIPPQWNRLWLERSLDAASEGTLTFCPLEPAERDARTPRNRLTGVCRSADGISPDMDWGPVHLSRLVSGVSDPVQLVDAIQSGADVVSSSTPLRLAVRGQVWRRAVAIDLAGDALVSERAPLDTGCDCPACEFPTGYLCHLIRSAEVLGFTLAAMHNIRTMIKAAEAFRKPVDSLQVDGKAAAGDSAPTKEA